MDGVIIRCANTLSVGPGRSNVGVIDVARSGHHGVEEGQELAARREATNAAAETDGLVHSSLRPSRCTKMWVKQGTRQQNFPNWGGIFRAYVECQSAIGGCIELNTPIPPAIQQPAPVLATSGYLA